jgi:DNA-binding GntR family transcriptional regulator
MALYAAAHLPKSISIVAGLLQTSERYTRLQLSSSRAFAKAAREHRELLAACRAGDMRSACDLLAAHIEGVRADLAAVLRRRSGIAATVDRPVAIRMHEKPVPGSGRAPRARRS